jgi:hypothetical protein
LVVARSHLAQDDPGRRSDGKGGEGEGVEGGAGRGQVGSEAAAQGRVVHAGRCAVQDMMYLATTYVILAFSEMLQVEVIYRICLM